MEDLNGHRNQPTSEEDRRDGRFEKRPAGRQESPAGSGATTQVLKPEELPRPTYWPAVLALGVTFFLWGFVSALPITFVGAGLSVLALAGWIREMLQ